jgi:hypothetical protein
MEGPGGISQSLNPSEKEAARLKALFQNVEPVEITGIDLRGKSPPEIARMLPRFTTLQQEGGNPAFGFLVDNLTGGVFALRSGFTPHVTEVVNGIRFRTGTMTQAMAEAAGGAWSQPGNPLGAHIEGQAAVFMRAQGIIDATLFINGSTPCKVGGTGCLFRLPELLGESATLTLFNKNGRRFHFTGLPD